MEGADAGGGRAGFWEITGLAGGGGAVKGGREKRDGTDGRE